jgi:predicted lactoylglutathione lyase
MGLQAKQIYVNLPVKDLNKSIEFFTKLGFEFNPQFTDENATCMVINEMEFPGYRWPSLGGHVYG